MSVTLAWLICDKTCSNDSSFSENERVVSSHTHKEICFCLHTHLYVVLSCSTSIFNFHLFSKLFFSDSPTSFLEGNSWSWIVRFIPIIILLGTSNFFFFGTQNIFKVLFFHTLKVNVVHTQLTFIVLTKKFKCSLKYLILCTTEIMQVLNYMRVAETEKKILGEVTGES